MISIVYKHICRVNGKSYIGFTSKKDLDPDSIDVHLLLERRWNGHCYDAKSGSRLVFHKAIRKYGESAFEHEILDVCSSLEEAAEQEKRRIKEHDSTIEGHGYNMTKGGEGASLVGSIKEQHRIATSEGTRRAFERFDVKEKHTLANRKAWDNPERHIRSCVTQKIAQNNPSVCERKSVAMQKIWCDLSYRDLQSQKHSGENNARAKLSNDDVIVLKQKWNNECLCESFDVGAFYRDIASKFNVTPDLICHIIKGKLWKNVGPILVKNDVSHRGKSKNGLQRIRQRWSDPLYKERESVRRKGEGNAMAVVTVQDVHMIRSEFDAHANQWKHGEKSKFYASWAEKLNVTPNAICGIALRKSWKHIRNNS